METEVTKINPKPEKAKDEKEVVLEDAIKKVTKIEQTKEVSVIVHLLNVREHANPNSKIVGRVASGDKIKVETTPAGEFYKVVEPVKGYVMRKFVG